MLTIDLSEVPVLHTRRLRLRVIDLADAPALFAMRSDQRVMRHIGRPMMSAEQEAMDLISRISADRAANAGVTWAMELEGKPGMIGSIGFYRLKLEHHMAEVGYMLGADHWGQGLMTEALEEVVRVGFGRYTFHRIEAITAPENMTSRHLLEKCGFQLEGILKENFHFNGTFEDSCVFGRIRPA